MEMMKQQGTYSEAMDLLIEVAAGIYMAFLKVKKDVESLEKSCTSRTSREKNEYKIAHPEFKMLMELGDAVRKHLRDLRLTRATIESGSDEDDVDKLINDVESEDAREE